MNTDYVVLPILVGILAVLVAAVCLRRLRALRAGPHSRSRRLTGRIALSIICILVVAVAVSSLFNAMALYSFWKSHPPAGSIVLVGQHQMHIRCLGNGSPTLVLETGLVNDSLIWAGLQENLAQTTRVCAYDRAGFGWSDSRSGRATQTTSRQNSTIYSSQQASTAPLSLWVTPLAVCTSATTLSFTRRR